MKFLTFDIEDYHHLLDIPSLTEQYDAEKTIVVDITNKILDLLKKHRKIAVFFILGEVAEKYPKLLRRIADEGHVIGSHSNKHILHKDMSDQEFEVDLINSINVIETSSGIPVKVYRAPGFSLQEKFFNRFSILRKSGIVYDFSLFEGLASHGGVKIPLSPILEVFKTEYGEIKSFPFLKSRFCKLSLPLLGGGYFRLAPSWLIIKALKSNDYAMTYFHPRDFCPDQPRLKKLNLFRYFKAYVGLSGALKKLEKIIYADDWCGGRYLKGELNARDIN